MNSLKKKLNQSLYTNNIMNNVNITLFFYYIPDSVYDSKNIVCLQNDLDKVHIYQTSILIGRLIYGMLSETHFGRSRE